MDAAAFPGDGHTGRVIIFCTEPLILQYVLRVITSDETIRKNVWIRKIKHAAIKNLLTESFEYGPVLNSALKPLPVIVAVHFVHTSSGLTQFTNIKCVRNFSLE